MAMDGGTPSWCVGPNVVLGPEVKVAGELGVSSHLRQLSDFLRRIGRFRVLVGTEMVAWGSSGNEQALVFENCRRQLATRSGSLYVGLIRANWSSGAHL